MAPLDVDGPHLEAGESENGGGQAGHRGGARTCGRAGRRMLSLNRTAGPAGWVPRPPRSAPSVTYEEEREKRNSWGGIVGEYCSPGTWRRGSWAAEGADWWSWVEGESEMMEGGGSERGGSGRGLAG